VIKATHGASSTTGVNIYREPTTGTKRKYNGEELYQEGRGKTIVKESRRVESRGKENISMERCTDTDCPLDIAECYKFAINTFCLKYDGFYYLSNTGAGCSHK
jgi:hypothetical protein